MIRSYFKIAVRHLMKNRLYATINVIGLSCGTVCILLAILYWNDEHRFDQFHTGNPHLYRITTSTLSKDGVRNTMGATGQVQGPAFKRSVPEIDKYVRVMGGDIYSNLVSSEKNLRLQTLYVDSTFFDVFTFNVIAGNPAKALNNVDGIVLTERTARKFFNSTDVLGKTLTMEVDPSYDRLKKPLVVTGVVQDPPANSSLQFDALLTFAFLRLSFEDTSWLNAYLGTFVTLHPAANTNEVTKKFNLIYAMHGKKQVGQPDYDFLGHDPKIEYGLQPMTEIHLHNVFDTQSSNETGIVNSSNPVYSLVFIGIALFIMLMATTNFINISIGTAMKRAKEIGIRKISGGSGVQIIVQFLADATILCVIAFSLSILLMKWLLPFFNSVAGKQIQFSTLIELPVVILLSGALAGLILLNGLYPAFYLSRFNAVDALYSKQRIGGQNQFNKGLIVLQFSLAAFLLVACIVYYKQMNFVRTKDLGYNAYNIIRTDVYGNRDYKMVMARIRSTLSKEPSIKVFSFGNDGQFNPIATNSQQFSALVKHVDENYLALMEIPLLNGRNFSPGSVADINDGLLVNEAFVNAAGWQDPIGQRVTIDPHNEITYKTVTGVIRNYHFGSLRERIKPLALSFRAEPETSIWIKFDKPSQKDAMSALEKAYKGVMPEAIYQYSFLDELNAREYRDEERWQKIVNFAAALAFILCAVGLFGMSHLASSKRVKEIGIRKVLGASVRQVVSMLTVDFLKLLAISLVIAFPTAGVVANWWLTGFAYHTAIEWQIFFVAALVTVVVSLITVSLQAIKAAIADPVKSLRSE